MSSFCENLNLGNCVWLEGMNRRNAIAALVSGFLFFVGWWILIDAASVHQGSILAGHHMCGVFGTLSFIIVNSVSNSALRGDSIEGGVLGPRGARIWLFLGFVMGFASVIASCWILFADFVGAETAGHWPGVALFLQNSLIFVSNLMYKFGRSEDLWG